MLKIKPISIKDANEYVKRLHRHNKPVKVARWACACVDADGIVRGVAIFGNPIARALMDGVTGEVLRVATDGTRNACSILYGACRKAAFALGYERVITYTLHSESQSSLKAVGFRLVDNSAGGNPWNNRKGRENQPISLQPKNRWEASIFHSPIKKEVAK